MNDARLKLETLDGAIVISLPGTSYQVTFRSLPEGPGLSASHKIQDDREAPMTASEFLQRAWGVAKDKTREFGWIVRARATASGAAKIVTKVGDIR